MKANILLLASSSRSRQILLQEARIPFEVLGHAADEESVGKGLPFKALLQEIAREKMKHALLPERGQEGQYVYVLAADSMGYDAQGVVHGKPKDKADAIAKLRSLGEQATTATAFCLDKKVWRANTWHIVERVEKIVEARYRFVVPEEWMERYLEHSWAMIASGAIAVEFYGAQFLEWIDGSYSGVMGLPMYELRQALEHLKFFD